MTTPAIPIESQIFDRVVTVLGAITAGATYWYTPGAVHRKILAADEVKSGFPVYMVGLGTGGPRLFDSYKQAKSTFTIIIRGWVQDEEDTATKLINCIRDVALAIQTDNESGVAGALGALALHVTIPENADTDEGLFSVSNFGGFELRLQIEFLDKTVYL